ncbi:tetraacyldisaccharide 4'-kinase [Mesorhizobium xinjiangense]|uniref:tetraacyldisaccharide 4'-kinase n=1 Tax=Mesorhizobium xinjiangense TaxID=2678685 RepID=UPI0012ED38AB|nr:tetraacyldisaccharide 4'-kinase [Mesorhizobium xinjiangense]
MTSEAPPFWWASADWRAWALWPFSAIYGLVGARRMARAKREPVAAPVLCVGNLTVGGTGKTPTVIALCRAAVARGLRPGVLSRGHGGSMHHPHVVDLQVDGARQVGDEPLLLARHAPVAVTPDRAAGARLLIEEGCDFLIMDDGFQSARIRYDYALIVIDARRGIGNAHVIPGGPMRAPLIQQMRFADAVLAIGEGDGADRVIRATARAGKPVYSAVMRPENADEIAGGTFLAFAGIGDPEKFFDSARRAGAQLEGMRAFGDHHLYSQDDIGELADAAKRAGADLLTTEKDAVRLASGSAGLRAFAETVAVLKIAVAFERDDAPDAIISATLAAFEKRRFGVSRPGS